MGKRHWDEGKLYIDTEIFSSFMIILSCYTIGEVCSNYIIWYQMAFSLRKNILCFYYGYKITQNDTYLEDLCKSSSEIASSSLL